MSRVIICHTKASWQPFCAYAYFLRCCLNIYELLVFRYYALGGSITMAFVSGYTVFLPGKWSLPDFLFSYTTLSVLPILFLYYKIRHRTKVIRLPNTCHGIEMISLVFFAVARVRIDIFFQGRARRSSIATRNR
jgi:hypothetical protein